MAKSIRHYRRSVIPRLTGTFLAFAFVGVSGSAGAQGSADAVTFPYIRAEAQVETFVQLANVGNEDATALCFYENVNSHCSGSRADVCRRDGDCPVGRTCEPGFSITEFTIRLTSRRAVGWVVSRGVTALEAPNGGSIPPVAEMPFTGVLRCFEVGEDGLPQAGAANDLTGNAKIEKLHPGNRSVLDVAQCHAVHIVALNNDGDAFLDLGVDYKACAATNTTAHFFDGARLAESEVTTELVFVPCDVDYGRELPHRVEVSYEVINESGERFRGPERIVVAGQLVGALVDIEPVLFDVNFHGAPAAQTRFETTSGGIMMLVIQHHRTLVEKTIIERSAIRSAVSRGATPGRIDLLPECAGDCNGDQVVGIGELVRCVRVRNGYDPRSACAACDADRNGHASLNEVVTAVIRATAGCPLR